MKKPKKYIVMAKSGAGKDKILKELIDLNIEFIPCISHTDRTIRDGETYGVEYYFTPTLNMEQMIYSDEFIETRTYETKHGTWLYGLSKSAFDVGNITIVDLEGAKEICDYYGRENIEVINLVASPSERIARSIHRQEKEINEEIRTGKFEILDEIIRRIKDDEIKFSGSEEFSDHTLANEDWQDFWSNIEYISELVGKEGALYC